MSSRCSCSQLCSTDRRPAETDGPAGRSSGEIVVSARRPSSRSARSSLRTSLLRIPGSTYSVDGPGTGDGFALFCEGGATSRRLARDRRGRGRRPAKTQAVDLRRAPRSESMASASSRRPRTRQSPASSFADLYALIGPESQGFENWSDADAPRRRDRLRRLRRVHAPYPRMPLDITAAGEESGTYDSSTSSSSIADARVEARSDHRGRSRRARTTTASADDNVIIENIAGSRGSLGWVGFAFADENSDASPRSRSTAATAASLPTAETIAIRRVPDESRDLYIYVNTAARGTITRPGRVRRLLPVRRGHRRRRPRRTTSRSTTPALEETGRPGKAADPRRIDGQGEPGSPSRSPLCLAAPERR